MIHVEFSMEKPEPFYFRAPLALLERMTALELLQAIRGCDLKVGTEIDLKIYLFAGPAYEPFKKFMATFTEVVEDG